LCFFLTTSYIDAVLGSLLSKISRGVKFVRYHGDILCFASNPIWVGVIGISQISLIGFHECKNVELK